MAKLTNRVTLVLSPNQFDDAIPPELGEAVKLEYLALAQNHLSCAIPPKMALLPSLKVLNLWGNRKVPIRPDKGFSQIGRTAPFWEPIARMHTRIS